MTVIHEKGKKEKMRGITCDHERTVVKNGNIGSH